MDSLIRICCKEIRITGRFARIARLDADKYEFLEDPEAAIEELRGSRARIDIFTFLQRLQDTTPKYKYPMEFDNLAALPISTYDTWWTKQVDNKTRNMVRRAERKGVEVREVPFDDALVGGIWEVYNECPFRQGKPFPHFGKDIDTVRREEATFLEHSVFIGAFLGPKLIGFVKLTCDETRSQAGLMNIIAMVQHRDKAPTNALVAQAVRSCAAREIPYLVYSNFAYGNKQRDTLADFKHNNGFRRVDLPRYYVPLTVLGSIVLHLGLHRKLIDRIPESWITRLRVLRSIWYSRKSQSVTETL